MDDARNVWVREYIPTSMMSERRPRWFIFDSTGALRWSLRSPSGIFRYFRPHRDLSPRIGDDHVLAPLRDADGVESVAVYRLTKDAR